MASLNEILAGSDANATDINENFQILAAAIAELTVPDARPVYGVRQTGTVNSGEVTVTFPAGRFSSPPAVTAAMWEWTPNILTISAVTTSTAVVNFYDHAGVPVPDGTEVDFHVTAIGG